MSGKKYFYYLFFMFSLYFGLLLSGDFTASANTLATSVRIETNKTYTDNLNKVEKVRYYQFTTNEDGKVTINLSNLSGTKWKFSLLDQTGNTMSYEFTNYDSSATGFNSLIMGLPKGTYFIKVESYSNTLNKEYKLNVTTSPSPNYETENNDTLEKADPIEVSTTYTGLIHRSSYDKADYYSFSTSENGEVYINLSNLSGAKWKVTLLNSNGDKIDYSYTDNSSNANGFTKFGSGLPAGSYYVKIENYSNSYNKEYNFEATFNANNYVETEPNNTLATANSIQLNYTYKGWFLQYMDSKDYYKIDITSKATYKVNISNITGSKRKLQLYDSNGKEINYIYSDSSNNATGYTSFNQKLSKGTYYINVTHNSGDRSKPYNVIVTK
ncbi:PPC domain-containing protein [Rummeliibacillus sp. NPDC094406]|uniref:PPC domain-containing protein n=1 Tax=Rummeliibacillus sp. NPDC094406 TaxID=3364511 RepID=UPI00380696FF